MRRAFVGLVGVALLAVGIDRLGDLTQNRPDKPVKGSRSEILLDVRAGGRAGPAREAVGNLWGACQGTVSHRLAGPVEVLGEERFRLLTEPALGKNSWRRLKGCLEDFTLDRVRASVVSKTDLPVARVPSRAPEGAPR